MKLHCILQTARKMYVREQSQEEILQTAPIQRKAILIFTSSYRMTYQISLQKQQKHTNY